MFIEKNEEYSTKCLILYNMLKVAILSKNEIYFQNAKEKIIQKTHNMYKYDLEDFSKNLNIDKLIEEMISNENGIKSSFFSSYKDNMMFLFIIKKLHEKNALDTISKYSRVFFLSEKAIDFLLENKYFNNIENFKNLFFERIYDKKYNSCYNLEESFKREYFKKILPRFENFFKILPDFEKQQCFDYLKNNIYTRNNALLKVYFSDLKVPKEDIKKSFKFLFAHEENKYKKNIAEKYKIYLNNASNEMILDFLKDYDIKKINPHIISYLFERNITKNFNKEDIQSIIVNLSSQEKIKVLTKEKDPIKKEEWLNYIFNENFNSHINFIELVKKEKNILENPIFLKKNLIELKSFVTKNIFDYLFKEDILGKYSKEQNNKKEVFANCLSVLKQQDLIKYEKKDIEYFLNNFLFSQKMFSTSPNGLERIEKHFETFCYNIEKYLDIPKELIKLSACSNIQDIMKSLKTEIEIFRRPDIVSFCEKQLIKESLELEKKVLNNKKKRM